MHSLWLNHTFQSNCNYDSDLSFLLQCNCNVRKNEIRSNFNCNWSNAPTHQLQYRTTMNTNRAMLTPENKFSVQQNTQALLKQVKILLTFLLQLFSPHLHDILHQSVSRLLLQSSLLHLFRPNGSNFTVHQTINFLLPTFFFFILRIRVRNTSPFH